MHAVWIAGATDTRTDAETLRNRNVRQDASGSEYISAHKQARISAPCMLFGICQPLLYFLNNLMDQAMPSRQKLTLQKCDWEWWTAVRANNHCQP